MQQAEVIKVFGERPSRMELLKDSIGRISLNTDSKILEAGCSFGDGIACAVEETDAIGYGIDLSEEFIHDASLNHPHIDFLAGSVYDLPFIEDTFELVFSQAAFSLLSDKDKAIGEYYRTLKPGGYVVINDFVIKEQVQGINLEEMDFIPCFNAVGTIDDYVELFEKAGFEVIMAEDRYKEIIHTSLHLTKQFKCNPTEMAAMFSQILGNSKDRIEQGQCFFRRAKISYGQFIFRKK